MQNRVHLYIFLLLAAVISSCASYRQNVMFRPENSEHLKEIVDKAESNYIIQKNDILQLEVYTNKGEKIIDPDFILMENQAVQHTGRPEVNYLVDVNGNAKFPLMEILKVEGLTVRQAEEILQKEYAKFYQEPYVVLKYVNKRVTVLGAPGGQVIPLTNENVRLVEVLALAQGINNDAKANNIRILRGSEVFVADLTTIEGYLKNNIILEPGDIVYVEPIRKPISEGLRDYGPLVSVITSLTTLIVVLTNSN